ncbi:hypothetical protein EAG_04599 [Camponotus floridanus]|uniref:Uncharacterized protein n=1 Tax=Camponotus floridanus TaxID=104421 RepID=E2AIK9_CAMFO|nr:hypothetical protein EAG_04599 [Camponotus floridanus]
MTNEKTDIVGVYLESWKRKLRKKILEILRVLYATSAIRTVTLLTLKLAISIEYRRAVSDATRREYSPRNSAKQCWEYLVFLVDVRVLSRRVSDDAATTKEMKGTAVASGARRNPGGPIPAARTDPDAQEFA